MISPYQYRPHTQRQMTINRESSQLHYKYTTCQARSLPGACTVAHKYATVDIQDGKDWAVEQKLWIQRMSHVGVANIVFDKRFDMHFCMSIIMRNFVTVHVVGERSKSANVSTVVVVVVLPYLSALEMRLIIRRYMYTN